MPPAATELLTMILEGIEEIKARLKALEEKAILVPTALTPTYFLPPVGPLPFQPPPQKPRVVNGNTVIGHNPTAAASADFNPLGRTP